MKNSPEEPSIQRHIGEFIVSPDRKLIGELTLDESKSLLKLYSDASLEEIKPGEVITGMSYSGDFLTLIDPVKFGTSSTWNKQGGQRYQGDYFPHHVVVGRQHLKPNESSIRAVHFTVPDGASLFYDWDAFGHMIDARGIIGQIVSEREKDRPIKIGESPQVAYFTGNFCVIEVVTRIGKVSVNHSPTTNMGGPTGVSISNEITISIESESPIDFRAAMKATQELYSFLSMAAGVPQQIRQVRLEVSVEGEKYVPPVTDYPSYIFGRNADEKSEPHAADFPLDPIIRPDEFEKVITNWMHRNPDWEDARGRYLGCIEKANNYSPDRLIAAANLFDLLPSDAFPEPSPLTQAVSSARDECREILMKLEQSPTRDGALDALGRIEKPSLRAKIEHRADLVTQNLPGALQNLRYVAGIAVKRRNFYVHGNHGRLDPEVVGPFTPFLTDTLEFIFAASDFVEAGWDIAKWYFGHKGWGHVLARYRNDYDENLQRLLEAMPLPAAKPKTR